MYINNKFNKISCTLALHLQMSKLIHCYLQETCQPFCTTFHTANWYSHNPTTWCNSTTVSGALSDELYLALSGGANECLRMPQNLQCTTQLQITFPQLGRCHHHSNEGACGADSEYGSCPTTRNKGVLI